MRGYLIALLVIAFLVGSLFQATEQTGMRIWNMFATMGIFLFGVVGSLALVRIQLRSGNRSVQEALKALEPDWVITDWADVPGEQPDYLLAGPGGLVAVCVDHTAGSAMSRRARSLIERSRRRARRSAAWVTAEVASLSEAADTRVLPVVLLTRRRALPEYNEEGVLVLNPEQLGPELLARTDGTSLERRLRLRITRRLRERNLPRTG